MYLCSGISTPLPIIPKQARLHRVPYKPPNKDPHPKNYIRNGMVSFDRFFHKFGPAIQVDHASIMLMSWFNIIIPNHAFE